MGVNIFEISGLDPNEREAVEAGRDFDELANLIVALVSVRKSRKLTQSAIAERIGTTQSAISDLERVGGNPTIRSLQRYARAIGCELRMRASGPALDDWTASGTFLATPRSAPMRAVSPASSFRRVA